MLADIFASVENVSDDDVSEERRFCPIGGGEGAEMMTGGVMGVSAEVTRMYLCGQAAVSEWTKMLSHATSPRLIQQTVGARPNTTGSECDTLGMLPDKGQTVPI
jgi:hypothetical protein